MSDEGGPASLSTRLLGLPEASADGFASLAHPTFRGSTTVFASVDELEHIRPGQYRYGLQGTPTSRALAAKLAEIEGAGHVSLTPSGLSAIALVLMSYARSGGHMLFPRSAYDPTLELADRKLADLGVAVERYDPSLGNGIAQLIKDETLLIWTESPGSITMEIQDIPAIAAAAHARGVPVAIDNTYGAGLLFDAFAAGADISIQALTKYQGGHSDVLMGSVASRDPSIASRIEATHRLLGLGVSPDDCALVLRGLKTLPLRMREMGNAALDIAVWLSTRDEVTAVLHPALPDCVGHDLWQRDWTGSASLFSVIFGHWSRQQVVTFVESLRLFPLGYSWGGANSVACVYRHLERPSREAGQRLVRLNIGLEDRSDLIADLTQAIERANAAA